MISMLVLGGAILPVAASDPPGTLLWQDRFPGGSDTTARVAVDDSRVFVAGKAPVFVGGSTGWLVRAYDSRSGTVLWHDAFTGADGNENKAQTVVVREGLAFAGGFVNVASFKNATPTAPGKDVAMLRAYDPRTGALHWENRIDFGGVFASVNWITLGDDEEGEQHHGGEHEGESALLYAAGRAQEGDFTTAWFVRAYNAKTGALVWQNVFHASSFDDALTIAVHGGRVFASGYTLDAPSRLRHFTVRAYDARRGTLLWQDLLPGGTPGGGDVAVQVVAEGNLVLAAGVITNATGYHFAVRAYEAGTGRLRWADVVDKGSGFDVARSIALHGGRAFVIGQGGAVCSFDECDWLIRTYNQETGALLWEKQVDRTHHDDQPNVVLACANRVVVAGGAGTDSDEPFSDWWVQVYTAERGTLVWENLLPTPATFAFPVGLAVTGNRLFVTGSTLDLAGGTQNGDYIVRAYQFGSEEDDCKMVANNKGTR